MPKKLPLYKSIKYISFISQLGFSLISPMLILIFICVYLRDRFGLPDLIIIIGILLGIVSGFLNAVRFFNYAIKQAEEDKGDEYL